MKIVWQVSVHYQEGWDVFNVQAKDDLIARSKAIKIATKRADLTEGDELIVKYCEIERLLDFE